MQNILVNMTVNGQPISRETAPNRRLLDFLREDLDLTSVKEGCSVGECGACTIIVNGKAVTSCLVLVGQAEGADIVTLEGLRIEDELHPLQQAFMDAGAVQCGYCTPGMILAAKAVLDENEEPDREQIKRSISGNLCRCTGYEKIIEAIELARDRRLNK
ncbi:MAG TPA: (2Fe-2S)-binding protein [Clostridiaceae bacterium]|nr:(2Fe-2S)-binding protein [Clostridiaceae bacterium]